MTKKKNEETKAVPGYRTPKLMLVDQQNAGLDCKYLRLNDLRRLTHFVFAPRRAIEGQYSGRHATPQRGHSVEFRDYRQYTPGDDVGSVDWKLYGRSDRLFVKIFESETQMSVTLLIDASASMLYRRDGGISKYDQACFLAAAIAFLVINQQDRVAFGLAQNGLKDFQHHACAISHLKAILRLMESRLPDGQAELNRAVLELANKKVRRGEVLVVLADLWEDQDATMDALARISHQGGEVILFHVMHPDEINLPNINNGLFIDAESGEHIRLNVEEIRPIYQRKMKAHLDAWRNACRRAGVHYCEAPTAESFHTTLRSFLTARAVR